MHERLGGLFRQHSVADKESFTLYHRAKEALASKTFMKDGRIPIDYLCSATKYSYVPGGTLGFYCRHAYAHANDDHSQRLPFALKGVDAIFYSVFHHLGLEADMHAIMDDLDDDDDRRRDYDSDDSRKDAELVATGLHGIQLSDEGGGDDCEDPAEVHHTEERNPFWSLILVYK